MKRREFLRTAAGAAALPLVGACASDKVKVRFKKGLFGLRRASLPDSAEMNILFIDLEDTNPFALGCYGNRIAKTPNIDRLAATGVRFERAFCQYPVCNASRSSFLTGLRPETTGVLGNEFYIQDELPPGTLTLPELMKDAGFYTGNIAKLFHGSDDPPPQYLSFDRLEFVKRPDPAKIRKYAKGERPRPKWTKEKMEAYRRGSDRYGDSGLTDEQEFDGKIARMAAKWLEEFAKDGQHFFLSVGSGKPHTPLICPKKYIDMYDPSRIPLPEAPPDKDCGIPDVALRWGQNFDIFIKRTPTPKQMREAVAAYYACVSFVDAQVGLVLDTLERTGLADNTIVVLLADHGFHLGEHGLWSKLTLFEPSVRVPLIVRVPGAPGNGEVCRELVELVDLVPTLCELAGHAIPNYVEGTSFTPLLENPSRSWKKAAFSVCTRGQRVLGRMVRTDRYKYNEWDERGTVRAELYDLQEDPQEQKNLAMDPAHAAKVEELSKLLRDGWQAALP